jgi:hypothetical protein
MHLSCRWNISADKFPPALFGWCKRLSGAARHRLFLFAWAISTFSRRFLRDDATEEELAKQLQKGAERIAGR